MGAMIGTIIISILILASVGISGIIGMMILGGVGFAIGSSVSEGWAIFGAILGGLIGIGISLNLRNH